MNGEMIYLHHGTKIAIWVDDTLLVFGYPSSTTTSRLSKILDIFFPAQGFVGTSWPPGVIYCKWYDRIAYPFNLSWLRFDLKTGNIYSKEKPMLAGTPVILAEIPGIKTFIYKRRRYYFYKNKLFRRASNFLSEEVPLDSIPPSEMMKLIFKGGEQQC